MDLWIRSQDRTTLIRSYEIYISEQQNTYLIRAKRTSHILGVYNTFERALEVLDEITNLIKPKYLIRMDNHGPVNDFLNNENNSYVSAEGVGMISNINQTFYYEMPKE